MSEELLLKKRKVSLAVPAVSVGWCLIAAALVFFFPGPFTRLNEKVYDWKMGIAGPGEPAPQVVHLDVDDAAMREYGLWPWDRAMSGRIVERLKEFGAKAVVFDVLYSSPGKSKEGDNAFFEAIKSAGNVISAVVMSVSDKEQPFKNEGDQDRGDTLYDRSWIIDVPRYFHLLKTVLLSNTFMPVRPIALNSAALGHVKGTPGADGVHRTVPLFIRLEDRLVPSLSIAALSVYWNLRPEDVRLRRDGTVEITRDGRPIRIPVDSQGMMLINWSGIWETFKDYSVVDVLSDEPDEARASRYKGKIVIVGVTGTGTTDFGVTPLGATSPLSRVHSNALSTIIMEEFLVGLKAFPLFVAAAVVLGVLMALASTVWRLRIGIIVSVSVCVAFAALVVIAFGYLGYDLPSAEFFAIFVPAASIVLVGRAASIELQASRACKALERYLSPELLEQIIESGAELDLSTRRRELTVVFVDIQGFSTISETVDVEYINRMLNDFFERMTKAIFEHKGTIDKFLGDGLLAFFGDPIPLENHALAAVKASLAMQEQMRQLNAQYASSGIPEFQKGIWLRIGVNTGLIIVGNVGSSRRLEYTVLGSTVNIASRLQSLAPPGGVIMTARTRGMVKDEIESDGPDIVKVKGIDRGIEVYRIYPQSE